MHFVRRNYFLILILIFFSIIILPNLNKPFIGHHDYNAVWHGTAARNLDRYGLLRAKFASIIAKDYLDVKNITFYTHYPPLVPIFLYTGIEIFGISHWSIRLVPLIFALATIVLIYKTGAKFISRQVGLLAAALSAVIPMLVYFSTIPTHDLFVLPFILLSINFYFDFFRQTNRKNFIRLFIALILAHLTHWTGYYLTPLFFLHFLIFSKNAKKLLISSAILLLSFIMFALHLIYTTWLTGNPVGGGLIEIFLGRLNLNDKPAGYSNIGFIRQEFSFAQAYYTRILLFLSAFTSFWIILQILKKKITDQVSLLVILGICGSGHALIFRNISYIHDYIILSLLPFITISASFAFFTLLKMFNIKRAFLIFLLCLFLILLTVSERFRFTQALFASNGFKEGVELGQYINQNTTSGQKALILSPDFKRYFEVFTDYYADRFIEYDLSTELQLKDFIENKKYKLIIIMPSRDTSQNLINILQSDQAGTKIGGSIVFKF